MPDGPAALPRPSSNEPAARWWEVWVIPALILLQFLIVRDPVLISHLFWLDEIHTLLIAEDPDPLHAMQSLARGVDFNPPTYYWMVRLVLQFGGTPEITLRLLALACVLVCCIAVFLVVRSFCPFGPAVLAALLIWSSPTVQSQAVEARFYAPWMAAAGVLCLCLDRASRSPAPGWRAGIAFASVMLCTIHYFGVISLALILGPWLLQDRRRWRDALWAAPGVIALGACLLIFYRGQRAALTVPTWVPAVSWSGAGQFLLESVPFVALAIAAIPALISRRKIPFPPGIGLVLLPLCLLAFSIAAQPALISRYAVAGFVGFALLFAAMVPPSRSLTLVLGGWLFVTGCFSLQSIAVQFHRNDDRQERLIARLRQLDPRTVIAFEARHTFYPVVRYAPDLADRGRFLALDTAELNRFQSATPFRIVERDVAQTIAEHDPRYALITYDALCRLPHFYVVAFRQRKAFGAQFAGLQISLIDPPVYELSQTTTTTAQSTARTSSNLQLSVTDTE